MLVLDVGSGVGGPARFLAATYGCQVTGIDLSEPFVDAARYLAERTGQSERVSFETASALELPFDDGHFAVADKNENNHFIFGRLWIVLKQ